MTGQVTDIFRHPVKAVGRERLDTVTLEAGKCMPWDRHWAVTHGKSKWDADNPEWMRCVNFLRGSNVPDLQAIDATVDESTGAVTFTHPRQEPVVADLNDPTQASLFLAWIDGLAEPNGGLRPVSVACAPGRGMTDSSHAGVSLMNLSSLRALSQRAGQELSPLRFRGNIWFDGLGPWEEFEWIDRDIQLGKAVLHVRKRIDRCAVTMANPETGRRDADPPSVLREGWQHEDFGVLAVVLQGGRISVGDTPELA